MPRITPTPVIIAGVVIVGDVRRRRRAGRRSGSSRLAKPKSSTFTVPSGRTLMFAGFRSRWMMPCSCAASSASAICRAMGSASSIGIGPRAIRCDRVLALDQLHHQRADAVGVLHPVDGRDVRMIQRGERLPLRAESARGDRDRPQTPRAGS